MSSPFDMITHSPIMQLANLARAGQNRWAYPAVERAECPHHAGLEPDSG